MQQQIPLTHAWGAHPLLYFCVLDHNIIYSLIGTRGNHVKPSQESGENMVWAQVSSSWMHARSWLHCLTGQILEKGHRGVSHSAMHIFSSCRRFKAIWSFSKLWHSGLPVFDESRHWGQWTEHFSRQLGKSDCLRVLRLIPDLHFSYCTYLVALLFFSVNFMMTWS